MFHIFLPSNNLHHIILTQSMSNPHPLRTKFSTPPPHQSILKILNNTPMHPMTSMLYSSTLPQNNPIVKIRLIARLFSVNSNHAKFLPHDFDHVVEAEFEFRADDHGVDFSGKAVDFFYGDLIYFVVAVEAFHVFSIADKQERSEFFS